MTRLKATFDEIIAKTILERHFGLKLELSDKPDLITHDGKGIEVVQALPQKDQENLMVYIKKANQGNLNTYKVPAGWHTNKWFITPGLTGIELLPLYSSLVKQVIAKKGKLKKNYSTPTDSLFIKTHAPGLPVEVLEPYFSMLISDYFNIFETYYIYLEDNGIILKITKDDSEAVEIDRDKISQESTSIYRNS